MSSINTAIELTDRMSPILYQVIGAIDTTLNALDEMNSSINSSFDTSKIDSARIAINSANASLDAMENNIRQNNDNQNNFNQKVREGTRELDGMMNSVIGIVSAYVGITGIKKLFDLSGQNAQIQARLNLINDGLQTQEELQNKIFASAQRARSSYQTQADIVSKLAQRAPEAFASNDEAIAFAENLSKMFVIAGASQQEMASASLQLTQALGSGVLRGEELNAVFESAPNVIRAIADYMDMPIGKIRELAKDGQLSADVVKNALLSATDSINQDFESIPMTWSQVWTGVINRLYMASQPILEVISLLASNWEILEPIVLGLVTALGLYATALVVTTAITKAQAAATAIKAAMDALAAGKTFLWTVQQHGLNAALLACPLTWIILLVIAFIAAIFATVAAINKLTGSHISAVGIICAGINVVIQFFWNLLKVIGNIAAVILEVWLTTAENFGIAFYNAIMGVQGWFYNLLSTALTVVGKICEALNKLPFIEFDYSGITNKAEEFAKESAEAYGAQLDYKTPEISEAFSTFEAFQDGWIDDAINSGYEFGSGLGEKISNAFGGNAMEQYEMPTFDVPTFDEIGGIKDDTGAIKDSVTATEEDLKYLRDLAEQETINRFTTAEIKVDMTNNNNISSSTDIDGMIDQLTTGVNEAMEKAAEGVHE